MYILFLLRRYSANLKQLRVCSLNFFGIHCTSLHVNKKALANDEITLDVMGFYVYTVERMQPTTASASFLWGQGLQDTENFTRWVRRPNRTPRWRTVEKHDARKFIFEKLDFVASQASYKLRVKFIEWCVFWQNELPNIALFKYAPPGGTTQIWTTENPPGKFSVVQICVTCCLRTCAIYSDIVGTLTLV